MTITWVMWHDWLFSKNPYLLMFDAAFTLDVVLQNFNIGRFRPHFWTVHFYTSGSSIVNSRDRPPLTNNPQLLKHTTTIDLIPYEWNKSYVKQYKITLWVNQNFEKKGFCHWEPQSGTFRMIPSFKCVSGPKSWPGILRLEGSFFHVSPDFIAFSWKTNKSMTTFFYFEFMVRWP